MAALKLKEVAKREDRLTGGHRLCPGCGAGIIVRQVLNATEYPIVVGCATGCLEVSTTVYPYTAWGVPYIHNAFENSAATISGAEAAYRSLVRQGKIEDRNVKFIAWGGDGGTYDIGLQSLSGALERGHKMLYICYNNEAYMNTGIQRSSATPMGAHTTTSPAGKVIPGKPQRRKDLTAIVAAHNIPYVGQTAPHNWRDLMTKVQKALDADGPSFLNILSVCPRGWRSQVDQAMPITKLAVDTCLWPLYEVVDGEWHLNYSPKEKLPVQEFLKVQGRFRHLFKPENEHIIEQIQADVDWNWERLLKLTGEA
jgi:pyruvate ferredoxin oxidoreductase beta subunit